MAANYYIYSDDKKQGPYDLVSMIKKIRNGALSPSMMVSTDYAEPVQAGTLPELVEFFSTASDIHHPEPPIGRIQQLTLGKAMTAGLHFLQNNQVAAIYTSMFIFFGALVTFITWKLGIFGHVVSAIFAYVALGVYMLCILRLTRGQTIEANFIFQRVKSLIVPLLISSAIISLLSTIGMLLLAIPGLFVLTFYIFTPLLVLDKGMDFWDAMETSRRTVLQGGTNLIGILFALVVITFVSGLCFILPLLVALPITISAISEVYDEFFYH